MQCSSSSTSIQSNSEIWNMGGPGVLVSGGDGSSTITWTSTVADTYTVTLTVTGLDGSTTDSDTTSVVIAAPGPIGHRWYTPVALPGGA